MSGDKQWSGCIRTLPARGPCAIRASFIERRKWGEGEKERERGRGRGREGGGEAEEAFVKILANLAIVDILFIHQHSQQTVGVIVRLEKEAFKVLSQHGKEVNVPQHAIQLRKTRAVALDNKQNSITSKDIIRVIQGPHIVSHIDEEKHFLNV